MSRFREHMGGFFHDFLRAAGITMTPGNTNERLRQVGERMAAAIEATAETKAIEVIRKLQTAVIDAFTKVEAKLDTQSQLIQTQQELIGVLKDEVTRLRERTEALEARAEELEQGRVQDREWTEGRVRTGRSPGF